MDLPFYTDAWRELMKERIYNWKGYISQILSEDSISCSELNNYISKYWLNLDAKVGKSHLLMFAVGSPDEKWFKKERERYKDFSYNTRKILEDLIDFYQSGGIERVMAGVHTFVYQIEKEINRNVRLPAIIFPQLKKEQSGQKEFQYYIFEMLKYSTKTQIEKSLFKIMDIAKESWEENRSYEEFIKKIKRYKYKVRFLGLAKSAFPILKYSLPIMQSVM